MRDIWFRIFDFVPSPRRHSSKDVIMQLQSEVIGLTGGPARHVFHYT